MGKKIIYYIFFLWIALSSFTSTAQYDTGNSIGYITMFLMLLLETIGLGIFFVRMKFFLKKKICILLLVWILYILFLTFTNSKDLKVDLREVLFWPSQFYLFFYLFKDDNKESFKIFFISSLPLLYFVIVSIYFFSRFFLGAVSILGALTASNLVFYVALFSPYFFLLKNRRLKFLLFFIFYFCVLISFKRSALVFSTLVFLLYFYYEYGKVSVKSIPKSILIISTSLVLGLGIFTLVENSTGNLISERFNSISSDKGSGRLDIFNLVYSNFEENKSIEEKLFGSGHDAVRKESIVLENGIALSSHNDYLEIVYDYGYFGFLIYMMIILQVISNARKIKKYNISLFHANLASITIFIIMSFTSHLIIYPSYFVFLVILWALTASKL